MSNPKWKVKLTQQQRTALATAITTLGRYDVLEHHNDYGWRAQFKSLNELSASQMESALKYSSVNGEGQLVVQEISSKQEGNYEG